MNHLRRFLTDEGHAETSAGRSAIIGFLVAASLIVIVIVVCSLWGRGL